MAASQEPQNTVNEILLNVIPYLDEKQKRILIGSTANIPGHSEIAYINNITGSARYTITSGISEITSESSELEQPESQMGVFEKLAEAKKVKEKILFYNEKKDIINQSSGIYGNLEKPLRWTTWSLHKIAAELLPYEIKVSQNIISRAIDTLGYSILTERPNSNISTPHWKIS